jgi:hypothetical protein
VIILFQDAKEWELRKIVRDLLYGQKEIPILSKISDLDELLTLINGRNTALDIKNMLDAQYPQKSDLQHVLNFLEILKHANLITY